MLETERLPRKPRELSRFMCQELLYEYMIQSLDEERQRAVEQFLSYAPDLQNEIKLMHVADDYGAHLAQTRISASHLDELKNVKSMAAIVADRFRWVNWPDALRWATQAFAISFVVAMAAMVIPWSSLDLKFPKLSPKSVAGSAGTKSEPPSQEPVPPAPGVIPTVPVFGPPAALAVGATPAAITTAKMPEQKPVSPSEPNPVTMAVQATNNQSTKTVQLHGMLFRMMMTINGGDKVTSEIKNKIEALGGEKAGQVELGWRKTNPDGSYFHFKMPESNYDELIKTLDGYGPVRIYKSPHERIMPPGEIRIILFIEDKAPAQ